MKTLLLFFFITIQIYGQIAVPLSSHVEDLSTINVTDKNGQRQGIWYSYDGQTHVVYGIEHYLNDTLHGSYEYYWRTTGKLSSKGFYKHGKMDGLYIGYWENGIVRCTGNYKNGTTNGVFKTYHSTVELSSEVRYIDGKKDHNYAQTYQDPTVVFDNNTVQNNTVQWDTIYSSSLYKEYEKYLIYKNNALFQMYNLKKGIKINESFYENGKEVKRIIYCSKKSNSIKKIFYYIDGEFERVEYINPKCKKKWDKKADK